MIVSDSRIDPTYAASLTLFNRLADCALAHASGGPVLETDAEPPLESLYTETHLALLLFLLNHAGVRPGGLNEATSRLQIWNRLQFSPKLFNAMAVALLGIGMRESHILDRKLVKIVAAILARRIEYADVAWQEPCGNNMYLQQLVTDLLLAPLAEGRPPADGAPERLDRGFGSCMSREGYFFDWPRPGTAGQRAFPFTYNLKFLFLLAICCRYLPDRALERRLRAGLDAILPLFTKQGDCSYFGRTDRTTFAAGLAVFCLRTATAMNGNSDAALDLAMRAERMFMEFPVREDGCLEVNRYPSCSSDNNRVLSRDAYAYPWQYALAGAAYCLLARYLFPFSERDALRKTIDTRRSVFSSADLGIVRAQSREMDLFVRTGADLEAADRRHAGPTILRLEHRDRLVIGAIPVTMSSDPQLMVRWQGRSAAVRHFGMLRYRWGYGFEHLHWELAGFIPVLRRGRRVWIPITPTRIQVNQNSVRSVYRFQAVYASGWIPALTHIAYLACLQVSIPIKSTLWRRLVADREIPVQLTRYIVWTQDSVSIADQITGEIAGKKLIMATRLLSPCEIEVNGLARGDQAVGWSSDGLHRIQLYSMMCSGTECRYEVNLKP